MLLNYTSKVSLSASNVNHQFNTYYSYKQYPEASGIDSLTVEWSSLILYAFPQFLIILNVLEKTRPRKQKVSWLYHFDKIKPGFLLYSKYWLMRHFYLLLRNICCANPKTAPHKEEDMFSCLSPSRFLTENSYLNKLQAPFNFQSWYRILSTVFAQRVKLFFCWYSKVSTARSENGTLFGENSLVCRLLKMDFNLKPSLSQYEIPLHGMSQYALGT